MIFKTDEHKNKFCEIIGKMKTEDRYHSAVAYLLALDDNISDMPGRVEKCFDFENDSIKKNVLADGWITGYDWRLLHLAFNLWNNSNSADVSDVFDGSDMKYFFEAIKIRFAPKD